MPVQGTVVVICSAAVCFWPIGVWNYIVRSFNLHLGPCAPTSRHSRSVAKVLKAGRRLVSYRAALASHCRFIHLEAPPRHGFSGATTLLSPAAHPTYMVGPPIATHHLRHDVCAIRPICDGVEVHSDGAIAFPALLPVRFLSPSICDMRICRADVQGYHTEPKEKVSVDRLLNHSPCFGLPGAIRWLRGALLPLPILQFRAVALQIYVVPGNETTGARSRCPFVPYMRLLISLSLPLSHGIDVGSGDRPPIRYRAAESTLLFP